MVTWPKCGWKLFWNFITSLKNDFKLVWKSYSPVFLSVTYQKPAIFQYFCNILYFLICLKVSNFWLQVARVFSFEICLKLVWNCVCHWSVKLVSCLKHSGCSWCWDVAGNTCLQVELCRMLYLYELLQTFSVKVNRQFYLGV